MKNFNSKMEQYVELKAKVDELQKQLNELKAEFVADLKSREGVIDDKGHIVYNHKGERFTTVLDIGPTVNIDTKAVKALYPGQFEVYRTRENFTVNMN